MSDSHHVMVLTQVELLLSIQRITEHFIAAAMTLHQSRVFDGVIIGAYD